MVFCRKKTGPLLLVLAALLAALFAGCEGSASSKQPELLTMRQHETGATVSLGYMRDEVTAVTGSDVSSGLDFIDGVTADFYWDAPGLRVDYLGDEVVRLWILNTEDWELMNGLRVGMTKEEADALFADVDVREPGEQGGIFISYDENLAPIPYNEFSPYRLQVGFTNDNTVEYAFISSHNFPD